MLPILLLVPYCQYTYHFGTTFALLVALFFICLYLRIAPKGQIAALPTFLITSLILYVIAGAAYLLFALFCAIHEVLFKRRWLPGAACTLLAVIIPYVVGVLILDVSIIDAFSNVLPFSWKTLHYEILNTTALTLYLLYLLIPFATLAIGLWRALAEARSAKTSNRKAHKTHAKIFSRHAARPAVRYAIQTCLLFAIAGIVVFFFYNKKRKVVFEVDYCAYHRMWPELLDASRRYPTDYFVVYAANRALYHTGRLTSDLFSYYQNPDTLLLTARDHSKEYWKKFDTYIDLGRINMAEHLLTESLEKFGPRPMILKRLALINMVKGNIGAARIYLSALSKTLWDADWANNYVERLDSDPGLSKDKYIQRLRSMIVDKNYDFSRLNINVLSDLLEKNNQNQMAFEYLMAQYLLTKQLDKLVRNLDRLDDFDYPQIPRLYEEAVLLYTSHNQKPVNLKGRQISPRTHQRAQGFSDIFLTLHSGGNMATARDRPDRLVAFGKLANSYGDSYFFYFFLGLSGMKP